MTALLWGKEQFLGGGCVMYLMIDNYDSFVYNLILYFKELGCQIEIKRNDEITIDEIRCKNYAGIIISPGPKSPKDAGISLDIIREFYREIPILGICLGHQAIAHAFGGLVVKGKVPMHGKVSTFTHENTPLFSNLPSSFLVTRYHSLVVEEETLPKELMVTGRTGDHVVMSLAHRRYPVYGLQYHPEALLTQYGHEVLQNFITICENWREQS